MNQSYLECIGSQNIERLVQFRVKPDADLLTAIEEAIAVEGIRAGVIVSGLGALQKAVFRNLKWFPKTYPVTPQDRLYLELEKPMELVSLMGWIAPNKGGGVEIHAHFSASTVEDETVVTLGGHLTEGTICGIKVVVAMLVLTDDRVYADTDPETKTFDIYFK
ncbi:MAG: DNA-binding protein [Desulfobacterales bacterium]|nr:MAG: DNA-binding protein [Desulfobacterales bacterium]